MFMDSGGSRSLGYRLSSQRCKLGTLESSVLFPTIPSPSTSIAKGEGAESAQNDISGPMVALKAILSDVAEHDSVSTQVQTHKQFADRPHQQPSSPGREATPLGRMFDFWESRTSLARLSRTAKDLVEASWRVSTEGRYRQQWEHWLSWC